MGDEAFLNYFDDTAQRDGINGATRLLNGLRSRKLHKWIYKIDRIARDASESGHAKGSFCEKWREPGNVESLLRTIEDSHCLPSGTLALWCPSLDSGMKIAKTHVVWDCAVGPPEPLEPIDLRIKQQFPLAYKRVSTLQDRYHDLWTFWVTLGREHLDKAAAVVASLQDEIGMPCDPLFATTALNEIDGYREAVTRRLLIRKELLHLEDAVDTKLQASTANATADGLAAAAHDAIRDLVSSGVGGSDPPAIARKRDKKLDRPKVFWKIIVRLDPSFRREPTVQEFFQRELNGSVSDKFFANFTRKLDNVLAVAESTHEKPRTVAELMKALEGALRESRSGACSRTDLARFFDRTFVRQRVEAILAEAGCDRAPVDLLAVAQNQGVHTLKFRPMSVSGKLTCESQGFAVRLHSDLSYDVPLKAGAVVNLTSRQRFTLAHEITHTLFYVMGAAGPAEVSKAPSKSRSASSARGCLLFPRLYYDAP